MRDFWEGLVGDKGVEYFKDLQKTSVYREVVDLMGEGDVALEFGAGVGRNINYILTKFNKVVAYELPNVIDLLPEFNGLFDKDRVQFTSSWSDLKSKKFDCILALSVLDHIEEEALLPILKDMQSMSDKIIVHGRRLMDDGNKDIIVLLNNYFSVNVVTTNVDLNNNEQFIAILTKGGE